MKSHIKITSYGKTLGVIETREYTFNVSGVMQLINALVDFIKEFSADRTKSKVKISIDIDKRS